MPGAGARKTFPRVHSGDPLRPSLRVTAPGSSVTAGGTRSGSRKQSPTHILDPDFSRGWRLGHEAESHKPPRKPRAGPPQRALG